MRLHPDALILLVENGAMLLAAGWLHDRAAPWLARRDGWQRPVLSGLLLGLASALPAALPLAVVPATTFSLQPALVLAAALHGGLWAALAAAATALAGASLLGTQGTLAAGFAAVAAAALGTVLFARRQQPGSGGAGPPAYAATALAGLFLALLCLPWQLAGVASAAEAALHALAALAVTPAACLGLDLLTRPATGEGPTAMPEPRPAAPPATVAAPPPTAPSGEAAQLAAQVTALERRLADLAQHTRLLEAAVSFTSNGLLITDPNLPGNPIVFANPGFTQITGYAAEEVIGKCCRFLQGKDTDPDAIKRLSKAIAQRRPVTVTLRNYRKDGRTFWNELRVSPVFDERGQLVHFIGVITDVTAKIRAEESLRAHQQALYAAKEQAELASRSKSEFLANMSHELRTPLNAVIGFSEIMEMEVFGPLGAPQYRDYAHDIKASGMHLLSLINTILDLSKIEAGKFELHPEDLSLPEAVESCLRLVKDRACANRLRLVTELATGLPPLHADERALKQILINLLSNAVKFTPPGGTVTVAARLDADDAVLLSVADTGIGIAEKDIPKALEPFGQVDGALNRKQAGTGLGLPLVKQLAELHGGGIEISSKLGVGTTVTVRLPQPRARLAA
ncbi:MAG: PAS domain-containing protein [Rhodospirillaceae bacterium]|nr:PAS domain-containing protein [Rhodospirillaceae bacterium]